MGRGLFPPSPNNQPSCIQRCDESLPVAQNGSGRHDFALQLAVLQIHLEATNHWTRQHGLLCTLGQLTNAHELLTRMELRQETNTSCQTEGARPALRNQY